MQLMMRIGRQNLTKIKSRGENFMKEHVKLEVSLEVINNKIANKINQVNMAYDENIKQKLKKELENLFELQEKAYKGDRIAIEKILNYREEISENG